MNTVIEVNGLERSFGPNLAVDGMTFHVKQGEVFGLLGPNGAGKTTTVRLLNGMFLPSAGRMSVLGLDPTLQVNSRHPAVRFDQYGQTDQRIDRMLGLLTQHIISVQHRIDGSEAIARQSAPRISTVLKHEWEIGAHGHVLGQAHRNDLGHRQVSRLITCPGDHGHKTHLAAGQPIGLAQGDEALLDPLGFMSAPAGGVPFPSELAIGVRNEARALKQPQRLAVAARVDLEKHGPAVLPAALLPFKDQPAFASAEPAPKKKVEKAGLLAFRDKFASLAKDDVAPRLGADARFNDADDASAEPTTRAMLTSNAPGSSGGINLASLSRNAGGGGNGGGGGGGGAGGLRGVQVGQVASSLGGGGNGAGGDRPLASGGPGLTRTDEEIQIVFDRYKAALYRLYNRELRKDPTLRGQMVLRLTIEPDGSVSMCALQASDMNAPELSVQVVDRVRTINFGAKDGVEAMTIVYPIDFLPAA